jgi:hypothetical protein
LPRKRAHLRIALIFAFALAGAGCTNTAQVSADQNEGGWFSKPLNMLAKPDWARPVSGGVNLGPQGPVGPDDMVSADGRCGAPTAAVAQAAEPAKAAAAESDDADSAVGTPATPASAGPNPGLERLQAAPGPQVSGGIALGMTECQALQRAGTPSNVAISAGEKGERKVVLTYLSGPWPGIYTFSAGRLAVVERAPEQPKPAKAAPAKKTPKKKQSANAAEREGERNYVR